MTFHSFVVSVLLVFFVMIRHFVPYSQCGQACLTPAFVFSSIFSFCRRGRLLPHYLLVEKFEQGPRRGTWAVDGDELMSCKEAGERASGVRGGGGPTEGRCWSWPCRVRERLLGGKQVTESRKNLLQGVLCLTSNATGLFGTPAPSCPHLTICSMPSSASCPGVRYSGCYVGKMRMVPVHCSPSGPSFLREAAFSRRRRVCTKPASSSSTPRALSPCAVRRTAE
jgi:hypothetical protein